ncbi:MAG: alpha-xylosidase [Clostridiales bacterium]|nr:alpha-xylosidase [Clostridiales bacterium]
MKFTEGFWLRSERANALFATEAYEVEKIPGGMRILAPTRPIRGRGDTCDMPAIRMEFVARGPEMISVRAWHYEAYDNHVPEFEKYETGTKQDVKVTITDEEAVLDTGLIQVRVDRKNFRYAFEKDGRELTSCGFRNLAYMRWNRQPKTVLPADNYLMEVCEPYMVNELSLSPGECVYGLGERFTPFVKNGQVVDIWNEDGGTASQVAYKNIPFYMTNRGYGVFVDSTDRVSFEVASEKVEYVGFSVPGEMLSYYFFYGPSPKEILKSYTGLTGRPALPPAWTFGLWLSTSFTTRYDEETTSSFIDGMAERGIPLSVFHFDCYWMQAFHLCDFEWNKEFFPDIHGMLARYHEKGLKICVWINPYIAQGTDFFREGAANGYLLMRADGKGVWQTDNWQSGLAVVDFTNPAATKWYTDKLREILDCGVDAFKTDFGERIPIDVKYYDGSDPQAMHNYYTFLYNQAVFSLLKEVKGEKEAVLFARSATAGCQQFPVHWGGDSSANYPSMAETLRGGLSFAMSGFAFWSHDISGFENTATPDLYKRWAAFGLLSSHSRLHGSSSYRVPWVFDDEASDVVAYFTKLKCTLMPYLYDRALEAHEDGTPLMRPMVFEFTEDPACSYLDMQYMLGDALLVAPVFRKDGVCDYYLPQGTWTHLLSGEVQMGGCWNRGTYDYFSLPLFARENTLLAMGTVETRPDYDYAGNLALRLYQLQDGAAASCRVVTTEGTVANEICVTKCGGCRKQSSQDSPTAQKEAAGAALTVKLTAALPQEVQLTVYEGTQVRERVIPAGVTEYAFFD